jgi:tetratricopeptide (TPR) repeat protein
MTSIRKLVVIYSCILIATTAFTEVKVWEEPLTIPTWEIGPAEVNPAFSWSSSRKSVYPYAYKEILTDNKGEKTYKACWLENEYVKVLVLPEIGGRLHGARDKTNGYNFFYWQPTIKPGLISMTGAWISGGIEWNFPHGHRPTCYSPVSYRLVENDDGSKTVWVGETEWIFGTRWVIGMTLYPDKSMIEAKVRLFNPTRVQHSYQMWATTAVHANENYQAIYPTRVVTGHGKHYFKNWPVHEGKDISWWKNIPNATSMFATEYGDFFGGYDHAEKAGTVLTGNPYIVVGKKLWTWGTSPFGRNWEPILTEGGGPYFEPQAGAYSDNQPDYHWIEPGEMKTFSYFFYPVRDIGAFDNANIHGALNLDIEKNQVTIGVYSSGQLKNGQVLLTRQGKTVFKKTVDLSPSEPFIHVLKISGASKNLESFLLSLLDEQGIELVSYTPKKQEKLPFPEPAKIYEEPEKIGTIDELWHAGEITYKFRNPVKGRTYFEEAIKRDPGDSRSHVSLAELDIKRASYGTAVEHLAIAEERDPDNGKIFYLKAVAEEASGNDESAYKHYYRAAHFQEYLPRAYESIAGIDLRRGDYTKAVLHLEKAIESSTLNAKLLALKAAALRLDGDPVKAEESAGRAIAMDPICPLAVHEMMLSLKEQGKAYTSELEILKQILLDDYQYYTNLIIKYIELDQYSIASVVLKLAKENVEHGVDLLNYYDAYIQSKTGKKKEAGRLLKAGGELNVDSVFPFRIEEINIFREALKINPKDGKAHYYLGLIYGAVAEVDNAVKHWKVSVKLDPNNVRAWRNLGLSYYKTDRDLTQAKKYYEKAFSLIPSDSRILKELDEVKEALEESYIDRLSFLLEHKKTVESRDELLTRMLYLLSQTGKYEQALEYYLTHQFHNWEGRYTIHNNYIYCCVEMAETMKTPEQTLEWYEKACEYPQNLQFAPREPNLRGFLYYPKALVLKKLNDKEEAKRLLEITSKESTTPPSMANYYQALALYELGKKESADKIMSEFKQEAQQLIDGKVEGYDGSWRKKSKALGHYYLSKMFESEEKYQEADVAFEKARSMDSYIERDALTFSQIRFAQTNQ